jgi:enamine deaminase RidA (YjgF/YER057c/UK114 family)
MIEDDLMSRGIRLSLLSSAGSYVPVIRTGKLLFVSGQLPFEGGSSPLPTRFVGKVPSVVSTEIAKEAARQCTINAIAQVKAFIGKLDLVTKFVKVTGYVNCEPNFADHSKVINGASDFLVDIFGQKGTHSRSSIGVSSLPFDSAVEVDFVCEAKQE